MSATRLDLHRSALLGCRRCVLPVGVRPIVSMARAPRVMLVGQAPGRVESEGGRPFAGRAGLVLFRWLADAGIEEAAARHRIYIAAVTRCFPGSAPSGRGDRVPSLSEQRNCADWLLEEVRIIRPRVLIPVGRLAIERFLPGRALDEVVGQLHQVAVGGRTTAVIPLPHPSGASSWIHQGDHPRLLQRAIALLAEHVAPLLAPPCARSA